MISVLIADDHALVRAGFRMILDAAPEIEVAGEAVDGAAAVEAARRLRPDVVLMDVRMPGLDGIEATRRIVAMDGPPVRVLMLTTFDLQEYVFNALRAGASGFLLKDVPPAELIMGISVAARGDALLAPSITKRLIEEYALTAPAEQPPGLDELTARELEVLKLLARGLSNAEIAAELIVSETTVKTHVAHVLMKLGLRDRVQAVVLAYECGVAVPGAHDLRRPSPVEPAPSTGRSRSLTRTPGDEHVRPRRPPRGQDRGEDARDHRDDREADQRAGRDRERQALVGEQRRHDRRQPEPGGHAGHRADQRRDDALVADHPPDLPARHPDRAQRAQLLHPLERRQHERVDDAEQRDDHGEREQHVEDRQQLVDAGRHLVDVLVRREDLHVGQGGQRGRGVRDVAEHDQVALVLERRVVRRAPDRDGPEAHRVEQRRALDAAHRQLELRPVRGRQLEAVADREAVLGRPALVDDRAVGAEAAPARCRRPRPSRTRAAPRSSPDRSR